MLQIANFHLKKCIILFLFTFFIFTKNGVAQDWLGINTSNYAGISNVFSQPASLAENRLKVDVNLLSFNFSFCNNLLDFNSKLLKDPMGAVNAKGDFQQNFIKLRDYNGQEKNFLLSFDIQGPSAMIALSPKHSIGIFSRSRFMLNIDNIEDSLAHNLYNHFTDPDFWLHQHINANLSVQMHSWTEIGLSYARILYDRKSQYFKAGVNAKILKGLGSSYLYVNNLVYSLKDQNTINVFNTDINYGHSDNLIYGDTSVNYKFSPGYSLGFDFGLVYEFRPKYSEFKHDLDGKPNVPFKDKNKYLLKIGIALTDVGSVKYTKSPNSTDFHANVRNFSLDTFSNMNTFLAFDSIINSKFTVKHADSNSTYTMGLPTTLSIQMDLHLYKGFYFNFTPTFSLKSGTKDINKTHYFTTYTFTPRWEIKWLGIYSPVSFSKTTGTSLGLCLRLGPVILGTSNLILPIVSNQDFSSMNAYFMLKVPIPYGKRKDRDNDGVSDSKDQCVELPGTWESKGCPDMDGDGVPDLYDDCPKTPGLAKYHGCPDTDKDGIPDKSDRCPYDSGSAENLGCPDTDGDGVIDINDSCPNVRGPAKLNGCPDTDGDGIIDIKDSCPTVIGLFKYNGCPDSDGDGIIDKNDECPTQYGLKQFNGCPDFDNDGVPDQLDKCPNVKGLILFNGCPDSDGDGIVDSLDDCPRDYGPKMFNGCPDRDMDSIPDKYDRCPDVFGLKENQGCPLVKVVVKEQLAKLTIKEQEILKTAFEDLEFETGKAVIIPTSFPSLDSLASVMIKKPEFRLSISGHTDNVGKAAVNQKISENRAKAVKDYLVTKSVTANRILTAGYGSQRPIAPNNTPQGRQKNRRVELRIIK